MFVAGFYSPSKTTIFATFLLIMVYKFPTSIDHRLIIFISYFFMSFFQLLHQIVAQMSSDSFLGEDLALIFCLFFNLLKITNTIIVVEIEVGIVILPLKLSSIWTGYHEDSKNSSELLHHIWIYASGWTALHCIPIQYSWLCIVQSAFAQGSGCNEMKVQKIVFRSTLIHL